MEYFKHYFSDVEFEGAEEVKVHCPFHSDSKPSASINTEKELFHCWVCDIGYNEQQFIAKVNNISLADAGRVVDNIKETTANWFIVEEANLWADNEFLKEVNKLGLSNETIQALHLGITRDAKGNRFLGIPVFYNNALMDVRSYNLLKIKNVPKLLSKEGSQSGFVVPYDLWKQSTDTTYVFEGEKDMMLARELGINAISLTGGAGAKPNDYVIQAFEGRDVIICYDNDDAGRNGAQKLYLKLKSIAKSVKYIDIGEAVNENKEDFFDFIIKYNKDVLDFYGLQVHDFHNVQDDKVYTPIKKALTENILKRLIITQITVSAEFQDSFAVPAVAHFEKTQEAGLKQEMMFVGEVKNWYLQDSNIHQMLELIEVSAKKEEVLAKIRNFANVPIKEPYVESKISDYRTVYKTKVIDKDADGISVSLDLYSFTQMLVGKQYEIEYKIYPHPTKHQKLVAVATQVLELDALEKFVPNPELLNKFVVEGSIKDKLNHIYQSAKHYVAKHLRYDLWLTVDLVFNSILEFDYGDRIRGALDIFILGDTQVGKSETSQKLVDVYNFGHFLSLKTSTTEGLIGGSNKVDGSYVTTIGAIPRQHKRLAVLEEFSGARPEFITRMTDVRSSGQLRLSRVAGEINVPCRLRMITISNPVNDDNGNPRHLNTFPNGITPIMELVKSAEDVSRYDGFLLVEKPMDRMNPFKFKLEGEPIPEEAYHHKIQWIYTRKPEDVIFAEGSDSYIWEKAEELNNLFESNFPLFTTTTPLKLARFSAAMAGLIVSTSDDYSKVRVTKAIVDEVVEFLKHIYDNDTFKLHEYKKEYDSYTSINKEEQQELQKLYDKNSTMFEFLAHQSTTSRKNLQVVSGIENDAFGKIFNKLVKHKFVRLSGETVHPTPKFRLAMASIEKNFTHDSADTLIEALEMK
jgi:5S rRNA maturation endonuclease (ribonuclease M5)